MLRYELAPDFDRASATPKQIAIVRARTVGTAKKYLHPRMAFTKKEKESLDDRANVMLSAFRE